MHREGSRIHIQICNNSVFTSTRRHLSLEMEEWRALLCFCVTCLSWVFMLKYMVAYERRDFLDWLKMDNQKTSFLWGWLSKVFKDSQCESLLWYFSEESDCRKNSNVDKTLPKYETRTLSFNLLTILLKVRSRVLRGCRWSVTKCDLTFTICFPPTGCKAKLWLSWNSERIQWKKEEIGSTLCK